MRTNLFVPKKIKVGFQDRDGTYTGKLAYVIYYDEKGVLRKASSWNSWRDSKIEPEEYDNEPMEGFVLNKKVGDCQSGWDHRQAYTRIYDPRGFEFEIDINNLLYILEHCNCIKGKGLEGKFVYSWSGKEIVLLPEESTDYKEIMNYNAIIHNKQFIKPADFQIGRIYVDKKNYSYIYMGKYDYYNWHGINQGPRFWFTFPKERHSGRNSICFYQRKTISSAFIRCADENCVDYFAELIDALEKDEHFSPVDEKKSQYIPYTFEEFKEALLTRNLGWYIYNAQRQEAFNDVELVYNDPNLVHFRKAHFFNYKTETLSMEDFYNKFKPHYRTRYLANGKFHDCSKYKRDTVEIKEEEESDE